MNILSSLLNFIGEFIGSNPEETMTTESKTIVGAINELNQAKKGIVERGTSNNWEYIKYSDGTFEASRFSTSGATGALTQIGSSGIYYSAQAEITLPSIGISQVRAINIGCAPSSNFFMDMVVNRLTATSFYVFYLRYGSNVAVSDITWWAKIEGKWSN